MPHRLLSQPGALPQAPSRSPARVRPRRLWSWRSPAVSGKTPSPSGRPRVMWLGLWPLSDGVRVEVGYATSEDSAAALGANLYRVRTPDGQSREFPSTIELLEYLDAGYCLDEIEHAVTRNCGWSGRSTARRA